MTALISLSFVSGFGHILFDYRKNYLLTYMLKPLTMLLIILAVLTHSDKGDYATLILAGLGFSLLGDVFLMLKNRQFVAGLASFLVAHLIYSYGFFSLITGPLPWLHLLFFLVPALAYYAWLYPGLGKLKLPVALYVAAIVMMGFFSLAVWLAAPSTLTFAAFIGAIIFMISDGTLALNKFRKPFAAAQLVILSTYYVAQWFIAWSTFTSI